MTWPGQPVIHEINTAVWLNDLSRAAGRPLTLADVGPPTGMLRRLQGPMPSG